MATLTGVAAAPVRAAADEYPTWSEVESARANESTKQTQINELSSLISQIDADLAQAQQFAVTLTDNWDLAQDASDLAQKKTRDLGAQAATAEQAATAARNAAGQLVSSMAKTGGSDQLSAQLLLSGSGADNFLYRLSATSRLSQNIGELYERAESAGNAARALTDQARVAETERARLADEARAAKDAAIVASRQVEYQLELQQRNSETLKAQLAVLVENRQATEADYTRGEQIREAAAAAAAAAAESDGSGVQVDQGQLSGQGWTRPVGGRISDGFGPRVAPTAGASSYHRGADLGAGCGTPVYAASAGTVNFAGWFGGLGNWVQLSHGGGVQTSYAHNSQLVVSEGQSVVAGQLISLAGTTGVSTGCHLHYEVTLDGTRTDPVAFMRARGAPLG
ncbi:murein DD-endopeptidase MepM/ murein hydrolase activator NlpD [Subtercola boreus]|nr:murein DD-endopeptidase MepM/ murein hydrolase activator NlpD [Subtercola boreus]